MAEPFSNYLYEDIANCPDPAIINHTTPESTITNFGRHKVATAPKNDGGTRRVKLSETLLGPRRRNIADNAGNERASDRFLAPLIVLLLAAVLAGVVGCVFLATGSRDLDKCEFVNVTLCPNVLSRGTAFPNAFGHQEESAVLTSKIFSQMETMLLCPPCAVYLTPFMCQLLFPRCSHDNEGHVVPVLPCLDICKFVTSSCKQELETLGISSSHLCTDLQDRSDKNGSRLCDWYNFNEESSALLQHTDPGVGGDSRVGGDPGVGADTACIINGEITSTFTCDNGTTIRESHRCDGLDDCGDGSDERDCPSSCSSGLQFQCDDGECVWRSLICDDIKDCRDGSDEIDCPCDPLTEKECDNGKCVSIDRVCDVTDDCGDNSDEEGCVYCEWGQFRCTDGRCISSYWECDGDNDCGDLSDEQNC